MSWMDDPKTSKTMGRTCGCCKLRLLMMVLFNVSSSGIALKCEPGRVAQSVGHLTRKSGVLGSIPVWQLTFVSPSAFSRRAVVSYWRNYVHRILVNRLGGLSLPRKSVVRLTGCPNMTLDVYRGRKTTMQQQQQLKCESVRVLFLIIPF